MPEHRTQLLRQAMEEERRKLETARSALTTAPCADENETASTQEALNAVAIIMERAQQRLRMLEQHMAVIHAQPHSSCVDCGEEIAASRLKARPDAIRCTHCQEDWEKEHLQRCSMPWMTPLAHPAL